MNSFKISSKKWYGRFWPPERRKIKLMQALVDFQAPKIEKKVNEAFNNELIYGVKVKYADWVKDGDVVMFYNGVDEAVHLDGTNKTATKTIKEPQMVIHHAGETRSLRELRANKQTSQQASPKTLNIDRSK